MFLVKMPRQEPRKKKWLGKKKGEVSVGAPVAVIFPVDHRWDEKQQASRKVGLEECLGALGVKDRFAD